MLRGDAAPIALLPDDAEVAELQPPAVADEHVHRRQVAMQQLAAVQLAEHLEDAGDLAPRRRLGPLAAGLLQVRAQVAVARVLEGQVVEHLAVGAHQREAIEDADRARVPVQEQAEVGLAQPAVDARADLDADLFGDRRGAAAPRRQVGLPEAAGAEHPLDAVLQLGLRAEDHLRRRQQLAGFDRGHVDRRRGAGRGRGVAARRRHAGSLVRLCVRLDCPPSTARRAASRGRSGARRVSSHHSVTSSGSTQPSHPDSPAML